MMKEYYVTFAIDGRMTVRVEAESVDDALKKATIDEGDIEIVGSSPVAVEEENKIVWEY